MNKDTIKKVSGAITIIALTAIICYFLPRRTSNFSYYFEVGKPWNYDALFAQQDFPIYKTEAQLDTERKQVLENFEPYYTIDLNTYDSVLALLMSSEKKAAHLVQSDKAYLKNAVAEIYAHGVLTADDYAKLQEDNQHNIKVIDNKNIARKVSIKTIFTPKTAYAHIINNAEQHSQALKTINLSNYLKANLVLDSVRTTKAYKQVIESISLTRGIVQKGQKIIDNGDIVSDEQYQLLVSLRKAMDEKEIDQKQSIISYIGSILLVCLLMTMLFMYLSTFRPNFMMEYRNTLFLSIIMLILIIAALVLVRFTDWSVYLVPFAILPIMVRVFHDSRTAFFSHIVCTLIVAIVLPNPIAFFLIQIATGLVTIISLKDISVRSQLVATSFFVFLTQSAVYSACLVASTGSLDGFDYHIYIYFLVSAFLLLIVYGLIFVVERTFGFTSAITLVELTNVNSGLLLDFARKAPGTFQHCLQVSNLAREAAKRINANSLLVQVGALYHDIGKMAHPECFIENQNDKGNPLNAMSEREAARLIIGHVTEGVTMAKKSHLPAVIINFIASHHGSSKVKFFYNKYVNAHPEENVDIADFSYPGPKPQTKEEGILMMADAVEARSRSLNEMTEEKISEMVEQMVGQQIADGELSDTPLSLKDVEDIKTIFKECLCSINHHRIAYPELQKK